MIYSMTGYGKGNAVKNKFHVEVELKSVNSRYLELFLKLPPSLINKEYELKEILKSKIKRGKVNAIFKIERNGIDGLTATLNDARLKEYLKLLERIKKAGRIKDDIRLEHIIDNKELFSVSNAELTNTEFAVVKRALNSAVSNFLTMKQKEGGHLAKDLTKRLKHIERKVFSIENEFKRSVNNHFTRLKSRIEKLLNGNAIDKDRLNLELAVIADKADITEECVRLKSHIKFFIETMNKESEPGRKLNFLCQELNREANTISSKSISTSITHKAVLIKEEIEKIREQIQNIE